MKKLYFLCIALTCFAANAQIVNIPDISLKASILAQQPSIDTNSDGEIQVSEASAVTVLDFVTFSEGALITDITGLEAFTNLMTLEFNFGYTNSFSSIDLSVFPQLQTFSAPWNNISSITFTSSLKTLDLTRNHLTSLDLSSCPAIEWVACSENNLSSVDVAGHANLKHLDLTNNNLTTINLTGLNSIEQLSLNTNSLTTLSVNSLTTLTDLDVSHNLLTEISVGNLSGLKSFNCQLNQIESLDLTNLVNLTNLTCHNNNLATLDVTALTNLEGLSCGVNNLTSLDLSTLTHLNFLDCSSNQLTELNVTASTQVRNFICAGNQLTAIDLTGLGEMRYLNCASNQLTQIDFSPCPKLESFSGAANLFTVLDFSPLTIPDFGNSHYFTFGGNPNLTYVNMKNGISDAFIFIGNCPNLQFICADEEEIPMVNNALNDSGEEPIVAQVNSYCSFTPGGTHNTIIGNINIDVNNNGCDSGDSHFPGMKMNINDGSGTGATFTDVTGDYTFYTQAGNFTITPQFENPFFTVSPASAVVNFTTTESESQTANFCLTPNGIHKDLEITITPIGPARPGFDANYQLSYKNKGNQIMSGTVSMDYNDSILDFVSANPSPTDTAPAYLEWDFTNLQPFESRHIFFTMNVNSPLETPAVNIGDVLNYIAVINPDENDETPLDNLAKLEQIVVGSMDPNDKTCVEGTTMTPQMVGQYLHYIIRFQNSGNFYAENVVVKDVIDPNKFDISTLQLTSSSHPHTTRITGNTVEFIFQGINLPAEEDDEPGSHGFVAFKIKTKPNLVLGDAVTNIADIFFDFNAPITTPPATTTVALLGLNQYEDLSVSIAPNPVKNFLSVSAKDAITSIQVFDVQGRLLHTVMENDTFASVDFTGKGSGVYFVKITTVKGIKVQKIIKE